jgi:pimeloyl-ACP methyl ester carboxylesterase
VNTHGLPHAPVEGTHGGIAYGEWPGTGSPLLCVHGISANMLGFLSLADALGPHRIVAPDLRGRGRSTQDGPLGLTQHAEDVLDLADALELERPLLVGHSFGAFVAALAAGTAPDRFSGLVLVDGGVWPPFTVPEEVVRALLATSIARLDQQFASVDEYAAYWRNSQLHLEDTPERRAQLARDLVGEPGSYRPATTSETYEHDSRDVFRQPEQNLLLGAFRGPVLVVRAPRGMTGDPASALIPDISLDAARRVRPDLQVLDVSGASHYEILDPPYVDVVAAAIRALL